MNISKYDLARFWSNVEVKSPSDCWEWRGYCQNKGYGMFSVGHKNVLAHRIAYQLMYEQDISAGMNACHSCDNPKCVNPAHIWEGTQLENIHDRDRKGRQRALRGTEHPNALLNEHSVREIRNRYATGRVTHEQLAREYGVDKSTVSRVIQRKNWKWVE